MPARRMIRVSILLLAGIAAIAAVVAWTISRQTQVGFVWSTFSGDTGTLTTRFVTFDRGRLNLSSGELAVVTGQPQREWRWLRRPLSSRSAPWDLRFSRDPYGGFNGLGFRAAIAADHGWHLAIPCWFLVGLPLPLLAYVGIARRTNARGRGFPLHAGGADATSAEMTKTNEEAGCAAAL